MWVVVGWRVGGEAVDVLMACVSCDLQLASNPISNAATHNWHTSSIHAP